MNNFVFCHGLGFNPSFWQNLRRYFSEKTSMYIDLGYFSNINIPSIHNTNITIGIGHSLGLTKLLESGIKFEFLIGINSFINFLGNNEKIRNKRMLEYKAMIRNFKNNPQTTLDHFYKICGIQPLDTCSLNKEAIFSDLVLLKQSYLLPTTVPTLIIASKNDLIVPLDLVYDNFQHYHNVNIELIDSSSHVLGFMEPLLVASKILSFINGKIKNTYRV